MTRLTTRFPAARSKLSHRHNRNTWCAPGRICCLPGDSLFWLLCLTYSPEVKTHEVEQSETSGKDSAQRPADAKPAYRRMEGGGPVMNMVQPIRDEEALRKCFEIARAHDRARKKGEVCWELLLAVGFSTSLRISDISRLRVRDLVGTERIQVKAQKTGKATNIYVNREARKRIERLLRGKSPDELVFRSRQKDPETGQPRAITRQRAYQIISHIARQAGIRDRIGCHTLRKTFGYRYYKATGDVVSLQRILCHSSSRETLLYIGVIQEEIDNSLRGFKTVW